MSGRRLTYTFGPLEHRGILGPVQVGQAVTVLLGALAAVTALDRSPSAGGVLIAISFLAGGFGIAFAPLGGRTTQEWAPIAVEFATRVATGRGRFLSPAPVMGARIRFPGAGGRGLNRRPELQDPPPAPPGALRDVRIVPAAYGDRPFGALSERAGRRLTAVLACRVRAFALLDPEAQERRLARWGLVLSGAGGSSIHRLQWIERTSPAQGDELARWVHSERDPSVPLRGTPMIESYLELIGSTARVTQEHEVLLAVQVDSRRVRQRGANAVMDALVQETERIARGLEAAEVTVLGALSAGQLSRTLRTAFDPYARVAARRARELGPLSERRRRARDLLDRRLAPGRGLAAVHGCSAGPVECGAHSVRDVRTAPG